jgi:hypothetical protein
MKAAVGEEEVDPERELMGERLRVRLGREEGGEGVDWGERVGRVEGGGRLKRRW